MPVYRSGSVDDGTTFDASIWQQPIDQASSSIVVIGAASGTLFTSSPSGSLATAKAH
jgi:hypothetical protein